MAKTFRRGSKRGATTTSSTSTATCYQTTTNKISGRGSRKPRVIAPIDSKKLSKSKAGREVVERQGFGSPEYSLPSTLTSSRRKQKRRKREHRHQETAAVATEEKQAPEGVLLHHIHHHHHHQQNRSSSSAATASSSEYAHISESMGEDRSHHGGLGFHQLALHHRHHHQQQQPQQRQQPHSRFGRLRGADGEVVEVQGGHIVRSTGRKDRHSKVCTAKGPRDRRVRLSAHTAIQFYDVQDRLGYDRPSKAVDWLIKNAKASIDQLTELPAWTPTAIAAATSTSRAPPPSSHHLPAEQPSGQSGKQQILVAEPVVTTAFSFDGNDGNGDGSGSTGFLPPSLDTNSIADTIKSFPMAAAATATSPSSSPTIGFQNYPPGLLSRTNTQSQDLRLSLQSFQDPIFHHSESSHHHHYQHQHQSPPSAHKSLLAGSARLGFDSALAGWADQNRQMAPWNMGESSSGGGFGGFVFSVPPPQAVPQHSVIGPGQFFSQRGPLQSSNSPSVRVWAGPVAPAAELQMHPVQNTSVSPIGFASEARFSGFLIPSRIQGEEHGRIPNKLPSATSTSRH